MDSYKLFTSKDNIDEKNYINEFASFLSTMKLQKMETILFSIQKIFL